MTTYTILVPFYNEEVYLKRSLDRLISNLDSSTKIFLIDDGSNDNSLNIAKKFEEDNDNIKIFTNKINKGKGSAVMLGIKHSNTSHLAIHDADLEYSPKDLNYMITISKNNPNSLILGSRFIGNEQRKNIYKRTHLANKILSRFFSIVNNSKVSDIATCYKVFPKHQLEKYNLNEKGFGIEVEILSLFLKSKIDIIEIPIKYNGRTYNEGKKIRFSDGINYLIKILYYRFSNKNII